MSNRVYFFLEIKKRELLSRVFASIYLLNNNYEVVIGKKYSFQNYLKFLKNGIYLFKGFGPKNLFLAKKAKDDGNIVIGMDEEGLQLGHHQEIKTYGRINESCMEIADLFFCWGENHKEEILKVYPDYSNKIRSTGNLRLDVAKENFNKHLQHETSEIKKKYGEFILLTSKFSSANSSGYKEFPLKHMKSPYKGYIFQKETMKKTMEFIKNFDKENIKLLLRPHPVENMNFWVDFLKTNSIKNIILADDNFQTNSFLNACKFNISSNCTTSLEAAMLNKKTVNFIPFRDSFVEFELFNKISLQSYSVDDLIHVCKNFEKNNESLNMDNTERDYYIKKYVGNYKENCIELMIKELEKLNLDTKKKFKEKDSKTDFFHFFYFRFMRKIKNFFFKLKNDPMLVAQAERKFPGVTIKELYGMFNMFDFITKEMGFTVDIKEIYPGCILFKKKG